MKIAITGHTHGLGKALFDHYSHKGFAVQGYSRQNGYDLRDWSTLQTMLDQTKDFDLIISNAKPDFVQTVLLYELSKRAARAKKIISIGSAIINVEIDPQQHVDINLYKTQKLSLQNANQQLTAKYPDLNSILIHPCHLYDKENIDHDALQQWILRMESAIQTTSYKEIYVE